MVKQVLYLVGDFETTVYKGQTYTEVWASAVVEMGSEDVQIFHSIDETLEYLYGLNSNVIIYYHNLKFDGAFWVSYLLKDLNYEHAYIKTDRGGVWIKDKDMLNNSIKYSISDRGQWYYIKIKHNKHIIEIRDSLKLLPFSVKKIGKSFGTKHKKLDMVYDGFRYAGCEITPKEKEYIANDVLVVKEALEIMFDQGHDKLTIGACCMEEFKRTYSSREYKELFPQLDEYQIDSSYGALNADQYIRKSYKGGWCYLVHGKENKQYFNGITADVNSLYPSMMSSESGNYYPIGLPTFWKGDIPKEVFTGHKYFFVRLRTRFYLKKNKLPMIQIKGTGTYKSTEWLETSDFYDSKTGKYYSSYIEDGEVKKYTVELTLTMTDYYLFKEHYVLKDCEILDGCWFYSAQGIFDMYIDKYKKIKMESTGAIRELAKLFLNNLYGKMATNNDSSYKLAFVHDDGSVSYDGVEKHDKRVGYIAIGSAITSYARNFTIRTAQANYYGKDKRGFVYADTDSIHCDLSPEELVNVPVHPTDFCHWKLESTWDTAFFTRQKTYIEHVIEEDQKPIENPYYSIRCAGMSDHCKELFNMSMNGTKPENPEDYTEEELEFISKKRDITDFKKGLKVPGKLLPRRISGGIVLTETTFEMR